MKVMLVSPLPPPSGGIATWTQTYAQYSEAFGIELGVVNTAMSRKRAEEKTRSIRFTDEVVRAWRILRDFRKVKRAFAPDMIHICSACSKFGLLRDLLCMCLAGNTPVVFHCHCNVGDWVRTKRDRWLFSRVARKARVIFVLNSPSKAFVERIAPGKTMLLPNFIEKRHVCQDRKTRDALQNVAFVGHVKKEKGIREIYLTARALPSITFQVIGPVQEEPEDMEKPENVVLVGETGHEEAMRLLRGADVFFFPSHTEGFSVAMLEAMAAGLPIVATDVGANRDMIEDRGGIIVPVGDVETMKRAILALTSPETRSAMSAWNRRRICTDYLVERVVAEMKTVYEGLLA